MRRSTRAVLIIAVILFVAGGVLASVGVAIGGRSILRNLPYSTWDRHIGWGGIYGGPPLSDHSETLDPFTDLSMDTNLGDIHIVFGDTYRIDFTDCAMDYLTWSVEDGRLRIYERDYDWNDWGSRRQDTEIRITVPSGTVLTGLNIIHDLGELICEVPVKGDRVSVDLDLGSARFSNITANRVSFDLDLGDLKANNITADYFSADLDLGSADLRSIAAHSIEVDCDLGSLDLEIAGQFSDYNYDIDADLGSIHLDGQTLHGGSHTRQDSARPYKIDAKVSMGSITIRFVTPDNADPFAALPGNAPETTPEDIPASSSDTTEPADPAIAPSAPDVPVVSVPSPTSAKTL